MSDVAQSDEEGKRKRRRPHGYSFLLTSGARTLKKDDIARMDEEEVYDRFQRWRFPETNGIPVCPSCEALTIWTLNGVRQKRDGTVIPRRGYKCSSCGHRFTVTSGTPLAAHKLPLRRLLYAMACFVGHASGYAALHLSLDMGLSYRAAFVLFHKLREAMGHETHENGMLEGAVEIDETSVNGAIRGPNDRSQEGLNKKKTVASNEIFMLRERRGRARAFLVGPKFDPIQTVLGNVRPGATIYADEAPEYNVLHGYYSVRRIKHKEWRWTPDASTNAVESVFSRLKRAYEGVYLKIGIGPYILPYADEIAWRTTHMRSSTSDQLHRLLQGALSPGFSRWRGYWQGHKPVCA